MPGKPEGDVLADAEMREQATVLRDVADPALEGRAPRRVPLTTVPPMRISPASGGSNPAMRRSTVVLPQPDGPTIATVRPSATTRSNDVEGLDLAECLRDPVEDDLSHA